MAWYDVGTVAVTNGSATVTGTGTDWISGARVGDGFKGPDGEIYEVASINSATSITLGETYKGSTTSGAAYSIAPTQSLTANLASQVTTLISDYQTGLDAIDSGIFKAANGAVTTPSLTFANDLNTGIYSVAADNLGVAVSGVKVLDLVSTGVNADLRFLDNKKATFGTSDDLQIYHSGSDSFILEGGTGDLILGGNNLSLRNATASEVYIACAADGGVNIRHDNSIKLSTTTNGIDISGYIEAGAGSSTEGQQLLVGQYTNGTITNFGTHYSTGAPFIGAGLRSATDSASNLWSTSTANLTRGAYIIAGNVHKWYYGAAQTTAIDTPCTVTQGMTLDGSGNLLVGKTSSNATTNGVEVRPDGLWSTANSTFPLFLNRNTTDGEIIRLRKDNVTVGSIGTLTSQLYVGSTVSGVRFASAAIIPANSDGSSSDADTDLGISSVRFKDIHSSGARTYARTTTTTISASSSGSFTFTLPSVSSASRGVYECSVFAYSNGGLFQHGGVIHIFVMGNPDYVSFTTVSERKMTFDSVTFSGGTLTINVTNTDATYGMLVPTANLKMILDA